MWKKSIATALLFSISMLANAATWDTTVQDDLFSANGKKALLMGSNGGNLTFIAECNSKAFSYHILFRQDTAADERSDSYQSEANYAIKVDEAKPYITQGVMKRRNPKYLHIGKTSQKANPDEIALLKSIGMAKRKIVLGVDDESQQFSNSLSASGSTDAIRTFLNTCQIE